jgi:hypothetical protein
VAESETNDKNCLLLFLAVKETVSKEWFRYSMRIFNAIGGWMSDDFIRKSILGKFRCTSVAFVAQHPSLQRGYPTQGRCSILLHLASSGRSVVLLSGPVGSAGTQHLGQNRLLSWDQSHVISKSALGY